jgi:hypothetical protein
MQTGCSVIFIQAIGKLIMLVESFLALSSKPGPQKKNTGIRQFEEQ